MEDFLLIKYKWQSGVYTIKDMINFVKQGDIDKNQFFEITRLYYENIVQQN